MRADAILHQPSLTSRILLLKSIGVYPLEPFRIISLISTLTALLYMSFIFADYTRNTVIPAHNHKCLGNIRTHSDTGII